MKDKPTHSSFSFQSFLRYKKAEDGVDKMCKCQEMKSNVLIFVYKQWNSLRQKECGCQGRGVGKYGVV